MIPDNTNERLEREARESLVAADLSAKMKQWRGQSPPPDSGNGGSSKLRLLLLLLAFGGAAWWLWPKAEDKTRQRADPPMEQPTAPAPQQPAPALPTANKPAPMAQKPSANRYLALAQSTYHAPNFAADIRGDAPTTQDALNDARQALADHRPADALDALQNVPQAYQTDADYLRAHALFALKKYQQSASVFEQLNSSVRYGEAAQWFQILALMPDFDREAAQIRRRLKKIADDDGHTFQREAKALEKGL